MYRVNIICLRFLPSDSAQHASQGSRERHVTIASVDITTSPIRAASRVSVTQTAACPVSVTSDLGSVRVHLALEDELVTSVQRGPLVQVWTQRLAARSVSVMGTSVKRESVNRLKAGIRLKSAIFSWRRKRNWDLGRME